MLHVSSITKRFGSTNALIDVSLSVGIGETVALIGPSGCGKSTLLRIINGLVPADRGTVRLGDISLGDATMAPLRHGMGYVIQDGGLFPHLSAGGNATLLARYLGWEESRIADRLRALVAATHLSPELMDRFPLELSGGQRQRVSLMRALFVDPAVLLLDEPLGALDPMIRAELQADLKALFGLLNKTVVLVTHDLAEAAYFADRIVLMNEGRIVQDGTIEDLSASPASPFVTRFIEAQHVTHGGLV